MKVELNTDVVDSIIPDTYGNGFQYEIRSDCWEDFKQGMIDKAEEYLKAFLEETDFKDAKLTMKDFYSPREYNFRTDSIDFELEFDDLIIDKIARFADEDVNGDRKFVNWLAKRYRSYDGFICWMPIDYAEFMNYLNGKESDCYQWRAIAAYLSYQIREHFDLDKEQDAYITECWEMASRNGYENIEDEEECI